MIFCSKTAGVDALQTAVWVTMYTNIWRKRILQRLLLACVYYGTQPHTQNNKQWTTF